MNSINATTVSLSKDLNYKVLTAEVNESRKVHVFKVQKFLPGKHTLVDPKEDIFSIPLWAIVHHEEGAKILRLVILTGENEDWKTAHTYAA